MKKRSARKTQGKRAGGRSLRPKARSGSSKPRCAAADIVTVTAAERRHLIEDVAFFRADRYRKVEPGRYRKQDRREAETDITKILKEHGVR